MNKKSLTEADIRTKFVTPSLAAPTSPMRIKDALKLKTRCIVTAP